MEGVGDHGCEYMTGGVAVVLGRTGKNFAAGMSGGIAYVLDREHDLYRKVNKELVTIENLTEKHDIEELKAILSEHFESTGSALAKEILADFEAFVPLFKKIMPNDYQKMLKTISSMEKKGMSREEAEIEAFYQNTRR